MTTTAATVAILMAFCGADLERRPIIVEQGTATYRPAVATDEQQVAERFRMPEHSFDYQMTKLPVEL